MGTASYGHGQHRHSAMGRWGTLTWEQSQDVSAPAVHQPGAHPQFSLDSLRETIPSNRPQPRASTLPTSLATEIPQHPISPAPHLTPQLCRAGVTPANLQFL